MPNKEPTKEESVTEMDGENVKVFSAEEVAEIQGEKGEFTYTGDGTDLPPLHQECNVTGYRGCLCPWCRSKENSTVPISQ